MERVGGTTRAIRKRGCSEGLLGNVGQGPVGLHSPLAEASRRLRCPTASMGADIHYENTGEV